MIRRGAAACDFEYLDQTFLIGLGSFDVFSCNAQPSRDLKVSGRSDDRSGVVR